MATYNIKAQYEYEAEIEADSPEEAEKLFLADLDTYYVGTYEFECDKVAECTECGATDDWQSEDFVCEECAGDENE